MFGRKSNAQSRKDTLHRKLAGLSTLAVLGLTLGAAAPTMAVENAPAHHTDAEFVGVRAFENHDGDLTIRFTEIGLDHERFRIAAVGDASCGNGWDWPGDRRSHQRSETLRGWARFSVRGDVTLDSPCSWDGGWDGGGFSSQRHSDNGTDWRRVVLFDSETGARTWVDVHDQQWVR